VVQTLVELHENSGNECLRLQAAILLVREAYRAPEKSAASYYGFFPMRTIKVHDPSENMEADLANRFWSEENWTLRTI